MGVRNSRMRSQPPNQSRASASGPSKPAISLMSAPAAKARSFPVRTIAPIPGSASNSATAASSSFMSATLSALSASGRLRVTMPTRSRRSTIMVWSSSVMSPSVDACDLAVDSFEHSESHRPARVSIIPSATRRSTRHQAFSLRARFVLPREQVLNL